MNFVVHSRAEEVLAVRRAAIERRGFTQLARGRRELACAAPRWTYAPFQRRENRAYDRSLIF